MLHTSEHQNTMIKNAYSYFITNDVEDSLSFYALNIIKRYIQSHGTVKDPVSVFAASLYISGRHPYTFPNRETRTDFAKTYQIKTSSLEWYIESIINTLDFIKIYDYRQYPYYIDPEGIIQTVLTSVLAERKTESQIKHVLGINRYHEDGIATDVTNRIVERLKLVPEAFKDQIKNFVLNQLRAETSEIDP